MDFNLEQLYAYLDNTLTLLWVSLCVLGVVLKQSQFIENKLIPLILLGIGSVIGGFLFAPMITGILKGAFCAGLAVFAYELSAKTLPFLMDFVSNKIKEKLGIKDKEN